MTSRWTGARAGWTSTSSHPKETAEARQGRIRPVRAFGQHFLHDRSVLDRIVAALELAPGDTVVEVGPGTGSLTERLLAAGAKVIAIEIDARLVSLLRQRFATAAGFTLLEGDVLQWDVQLLLDAGGHPAGQPYLVAANLPYNAGAAILRHFLEAARQPRRLVVMLQREVAENIVGTPGNLGLLAVAVQVYSEPRRLFNVPPGAFQPPPKVVSSVLRLDVRPQPLVPAEERQRFFRVVRAGFSAPRKQLRNALANGLKLAPDVVTAAIARAGLDPTARPQQLTIEAWLRLTRELGDNE